jgi:hypothetical protein
MSNQRYTMLSELEEGMAGNGNEPSFSESPQIQKFIRGGHAPPMESGMERGGYGNINYGGAQQPNNVPLEQILQQLMHRPVSCVEISEHVQSCPICSKFYSTDNTAYIVLIVILTVVCLMLLKRVLNL